MASSVDWKILCLTYGPAAKPFGVASSYMIARDFESKACSTSDGISDESELQMVARSTLERPNLGFCKNVYQAVESMAI